MASAPSAGRTTPVLGRVACRIGAHEDSYVGVLLGRPLARCERCDRLRPIGRRALAAYHREPREPPTPDAA